MQHTVEEEEKHREKTKVEKADQLDQVAQHDFWKWGSAQSDFETLMNFNQPAIISLKKPKCNCDCNEPLSEGLKEPISFSLGENFLFTGRAAAV